MMLVPYSWIGKISTGKLLHRFSAIKILISYFAELEKIILNSYGTRENPE